MFHAFDLLIVLMPFSCKDYDISRFSMLDGIADGFFSIDDLNVFSICFLNSCFNIIDDRLWFLKSWVI